MAEASEHLRDSEGVFDLISHILNADTVHSHGVVACNRLAGSLEPLQRLCIEEMRMMEVACFTVRYQLDSGATFGTALAALLDDMRRIVDGKGPYSTVGAFLPPNTSPSWRELLGPIHSRISVSPERETGTLDSSFIDMFLTMFGESVSPRMRLMIFIEVYGSDGDQGATTAWRQAQEILFDRLPWPFVLVVSGVPEGYTIPSAPHYLEIAVVDAAPPPPSPTASRYAPSSLHSDRPTSIDLLGVKDYADALARFVLHEETRPPLTIGIHGPWGKGKSSFMEMIETALFHGNKNVQWGEVDRCLAKMAGLPDDPSGPSREGRDGFPLGRRPAAMMGSWDELIDEALPGHGTTRSFPNGLWWRIRLRWALRGVRKEMREKFISIHFNAWQFQDATQTWAGLAHVISEKLERSLSWSQRLMMRVAYAWNYRRQEMALDLIPVAAITVAAIVLLLIPGVRDGIAKGLDQGDPLGGLLKYALPAGSVLALLWALAWRITKVAQPVSERVASYIKRPDHRAQMGYQHKVMEDLQFVHRHVRRHRSKCRVIVYVDDLDRCSDEKIMEILRAVNLILANCRFFVFLGMDTEMIHRSIETHYGGSEKLPEKFAEHYLRKIVQLSVHLPAAPPERLCELTSSLFSPRSQKALRERAARRGTNGPISTDAQRETPNGDRMPTDGTLKFDMTTIHRPLSIEEDVMDTADELEAFHDFKEFLSDNPREIKRLVNVHRLVKILLRRADGLWPVEQQRQLVKWVIFCSLWPELVDDVLRVAEEVATGALPRGELNEPDGRDCIDLIATEARYIRGTISQPSLEPDDRSRLKAFAKIGAPLPVLACRELTLAAQLSQMLHIPPTPKATTA